MCIHIYIYIYIHMNSCGHSPYYKYFVWRASSADGFFSHATCFLGSPARSGASMGNSRVHGGFPGKSESTNLSRDGIFMSMGDFPESLSQQILVGITLAWRLGICTARHWPATYCKSGCLNAHIMVSLVSKSLKSRMFIHGYAHR